MARWIKYLVDANKDWSGYRDPAEMRDDSDEPKWAILERVVRTFPKHHPLPTAYAKMVRSPGGGP